MHSAVLMLWPVCTSSTREDAEPIQARDAATILGEEANLNQSEARELITTLTRWSIWTDVHKTASAQVQPLENNLRSFNIWTAAKSGSADWRGARGGTGWLKAYSVLEGQKAAAGLLEEQNVSKDSKLWGVVQQ